MSGCNGELGERWEIKESWSVKGRGFFVLERRVALDGSKRMEEEGREEVDWSSEECKGRDWE